MTNAIKLSCRCNSVTAALDIPAKRSVTRIVCYCDDCQAYARYLGQDADVLDANGGSDIVQISPAWFRFRSGKSRISNVQLSDKGIYRWYASCCNSPICNTPTSPSMPYLGVLTNNINGNASHIEKLVGPVKFGVGAGAQQPIDAPWPVAKGFGFKGLFGTLRNMGRWRMAGDQHKSEFIDAQTGAPMVEPDVLSIEARDQLRK